MIIAGQFDTEALKAFKLREAAQAKVAVSASFSVGLIAFVDSIDNGRPQSTPFLDGLSRCLVHPKEGRTANPIG